MELNCSKLNETVLQKVNAKLALLHEEIEDRELKESTDNEIDIDFLIPNNVLLSPPVS